MTTHYQDLDLEDTDLNSQIDAEQRSSEWIVFLNSEHATDDDRQRFKQWLSLDTRHQLAYQKTSAIWQAAAAMESLKSIEPRFLEQNKISLWPKIKKPLSINLTQTLLATAAVITFCLGFFFLIQPSQNPDTTQHYQTATAEKQLITLPDGSEITLSPQTQIEVRYSDKKRHIKLQRGEAYFVVAKNPQRPFIVDSGHTRIKVLGTVFNVNGNTLNTIVSVAEGKVQVSSVSIPGYRDAETKLTTGQQVRVSEAKGVGRKRTINADNAGAWRRGVRIYQSQPLQHVLLDLGRYHSAELIITDDALKSHPVTSVFLTDNVEQMLKALESVLPIHIVQVSANRIEIRPR